MGPLLIFGEKITYGEAAALQVNHILDWLLQHRPYHLLLWVFPIIGLAVLINEMMRKIGK
jgi:hypothetical protein